MHQKCDLGVSTATTVATSTSQGLIFSVRPLAGKVESGDHSFELCQCLHVARPLLIFFDSPVEKLLGAAAAHPT